MGVGVGGVVGLAGKKANSAPHELELGMLLKLFQAQVHLKLS